MPSSARNELKVNTETNKKINNFFTGLIFKFFEQYLSLKLQNYGKFQYQQKNREKN